MGTKREEYDRKRNEISKRCETCRKGISAPSIERCDECTVGRKLRMLEVEYASVTGWSHKSWQT